MVLIHYILFSLLLLKQNGKREEEERKKAERNHISERDETDFDMPDGADVTDEANETTAEEEEGVIDSLTKKIRRGKILRRRSMIQHAN